MRKRRFDLYQRRRGQVAFDLDQGGGRALYLYGHHANGPQLLESAAAFIDESGCDCAYLHGAGFRPAQPWLGSLMSPADCWTVMPVSGALLAATR
jgi:hypothetical protein